MGNLDFHKIVEAVVKHNLGIEHHNHVNPTEHLEHFFVQVEVNGTDRLGVGSFKIEDDLVFFSPHSALDLVRPHTQAIVTNVVFKKLLLFGHGVFNELAHRALVSCEQLIERRIKNVVAKSTCHFNDTLLGRTDSRN